MTVQVFADFEAEPLYQEYGWLVGEGACGGKAKGLAFAFASLRGDPLEPTIRFPDFNWVLSTEVFDSFLEENGLGYLYDLEEPEEGLGRVDSAPLPRGLSEDLETILERAGDIPLAVRSSSRLEDSVHLSFAGKYETCFSANVGSRAERLARLERCVRTVWASLFNPSARAYRNKRRIPHRMESMAVLIQPVVGRRRGDLHYPELAGTVFSRVFRRPSPRIRKEDGVMRLGFGLGTRTVERGSARIFYLTNPNLRPEGNTPRQIAESSQSEFDALDLSRGTFLTCPLPGLFYPFVLKHHRNASAFLELFAEDALYSTLSSPEGPALPYFTMGGLPSRCRCIFDQIRRLTAFMEARMGLPVDMEFAIETEGPEFRLLQLRPLASYEEMARVHIPEVSPERLLLRGDRMVSNGFLRTERLVLVDPDLYLAEWDPGGCARAVGEINEALEGTRYVLAGPGRWGSRNPALGVPVQYADLCHCGCLVEVSLPKSDFTPELSYGTHFFLDMDGDGILYLPVFGGQKGNVCNRDWFEGHPFRTGSHPAVRIYEGRFTVALDGESEIGAITCEEED
jgi:hypothetical protein